MKSAFSILIFLSIATFSMAQKTVLLEIEHKLGDKTYTTEELASNDKGNDFTVERMQYYLSQLAIVHDDGKVSKAKDVYLLIDASANGNYTLGQFNFDSIERLQFSVGVNTPENNADPALWPKDHPLAPKSPEMHWGWAAGYRFVAMEGKTDEMLTSNYEIHALGNSNYFNIELVAETTEKGDTVIIKMKADYAKALMSIDISGGNITHGESDFAKTLLENFRDHVFTSTNGKGNTLGIEKDQKPVEFAVYPNPSVNGQVHLYINNLAPSKYQVSITNMLGKRLQSHQIASNVDYNIGIKERGLFIITVSNEQGLFKSEKLLVK